MANFPRFLNRSWKTFRVFRRFQQLSSSTAWRVMMVQTCAISPKHVAHEGLTKHYWKTFQWLSFY